MRMSTTQIIIVCLAAIAVAAIVADLLRRVHTEVIEVPAPANHTHTRDDNTARLVAIAELLLINQIARSDPDAARIAAARYAIGDKHKTPDLPEEVKEQLRRQYMELARVERENEAADLGNPQEPEPVKPRGTIRVGFGPL